MFQHVNLSFIWILNFGRSRLVFLVFDVVMCPVPALIWNCSAQPEHRNTNRLRKKFRIHIEKEFTGRIFCFSTVHITLKHEKKLFLTIVTVVCEPILVAKQAKHVLIGAIPMCFH